MKMRSVFPIWVAKIGYIIVSILMCVIGILFFVVPDKSLKALGIACGIAAIMYGLVKIEGYLSKDLYRLAFQHGLETGLFFVLIGVIVLMNPQNLINVLCVLTGVAMLIDGLFKLRISQDSRSFGINNWWLILIMSLISCVMGIVLALKPVDNSVLLSYMLGCAYLITGILNFIISILTVKVVKHQRPDKYECNYIEYEECCDEESEEDGQK